MSAGRQQQLIAHEVNWSAAPVDEDLKSNKGEEDVF